MRPLSKMDETVIGEHVALSRSDACYYLLEFQPGRRYSFHPDVDLVKNLKRRIDRSGIIALRRKEWAIRNAARLLRPALAELIEFSATTFVPIPPSRMRSNLYFDDRIARLLRLACPSDADIRELVVCREDRTPAHHSAERPSVPALMENYKAMDAGREPVRESIVLFDDVVTTGNHFVACKKFLLEHFPGRRVLGVFLSRRVLP